MSLVSGAWSWGLWVLFCVGDDVWHMTYALCAPAEALYRLGLGL